MKSKQNVPMLPMSHGSFLSMKIGSIDTKRIPREYVMLPNTAKTNIGRDRPSVD